jgi:hypothetical protein
VSAAEHTGERRHSVTPRECHHKVPRRARRGHCPVEWTATSALTDSGARDSPCDVKARRPWRCRPARWQRRAPAGGRPPAGSSAECCGVRAVALSPDLMRESLLDVGRGPAGTADDRPPFGALRRQGRPCPSGSRQCGTGAEGLIHHRSIGRKSPSTVAMGGRATRDNARSASCCQTSSA